MHYFGSLGTVAIHPWQWHADKTCRDIRTGQQVDPDACEGTWRQWDQARRTAGPELDALMASTYAKPKSNGKSNMTMPLLVGGGLLVAFLLWKRKG